MVSEITINRLENVLTEVIDFSGTKEQTTIVSNMAVVNASPSGSVLSGFVTITDERDGDTILASKVPGVLYANGDLVNVLFIDGTEPIAFQQASASSGDPVAVSKLVSPDLAIDPVISADNAGDVTLAGTGDLILPDDIIHSGDTDTLISLEDDKIVLQAGALEMVSIIEAATDEVVINDAQANIDFRVESDSIDDLLFCDAGGNRVGIGTDAPSVGPINIFGLHVKEGVANCGLFVDAGAGQTAVYYMGKAGSTEWQFQSGAPGDYQVVEAGATIRMTIETGGNVEIGTGTPSAQLHVDQASTTAAEPVLLLDQADISEEFLKLVGAAAAATLTQSFVDEGDVTTATRIGWYKINIDDVGNQITDGDYWVPFFSLA